MCGARCPTIRAPMASRRPSSSRGGDAARTGARARPTVMVVHGPNLDLLGAREPGIYGRTTLAQLDARLVELGDTLGLHVIASQANSEGTIIDLLHSARTFA